MTGPAAFDLVQNPVKFEKFDKMTKIWQKITFNVKSLVILRRETRQISVELLIWKIPNFSQKMSIFKIVSLSPPCKGKFHRKKFSKILSFLRLDSWIGFNGPHTNPNQIILPQNGSKR